MTQVPNETIQRADGGKVAHSDQIATGDATTSSSQSVATVLAQLQSRGGGSLSPALLELERSMTQSHAKGEIIHTAPYTSVSTFAVTDRSTRTVTFDGDENGLSINAGTIEGWETNNSWHFAVAAFHIPDDIGTVSLNAAEGIIKWRDGNTSRILLGIDDQNNYFIGNPDGENNNSQGNPVIAESQYLGSENDTRYEMTAGDWIAIECEPLPNGIGFNIWLGRNDDVIELNNVSFVTSTVFSLNNLHLEHIAESGNSNTLVDKGLLAASSRYESHADFDNAIVGHLDEDSLGLRTEGAGHDYINVDTPIAFPKSESYHFCVGSIDGSGTGLVTELVANENTDITVGNSHVTVNNGSKGIDIPMRFDMDKSGSNIPEGVTYNSADGSVVLPAGIYDLDTSVEVTNRTSGTQNGNRMGVELDILNGSDVTSGDSAYIRYSANTSGGTAAVDFLTRSRINLKVTIKSDGASAIKAVLKLRTQYDNCTARIKGANIHIKRA